MKLRGGRCTIIERHTLFTGLKGVTAVGGAIRDQRSQISAKLFNWDILIILVEVCRELGLLSSFGLGGQEEPPFILKTPAQGASTLKQDLTIEEG